jgi:hypothetical protein
MLGHARRRLGRMYIPNRPLNEQRDGLECWSAELSRLLAADKSGPTRRRIRRASRHLGEMIPEPEILQRVRAAAARRILFLPHAIKAMAIAA